METLSYCSVRTGVRRHTWCIMQHISLYIQLQVHGANSFDADNRQRYSYKPTKQVRTILLSALNVRQLLVNQSHVLCQKRNTHYGPSCHPLPPSSANTLFLQFSITLSTSTPTCSYAPKIALINNLTSSPPSAFDYSPILPPIISLFFSFWKMPDLTLRLPRLRSSAHPRKLVIYEL